MISKEKKKNKAKTPVKLRCPLAFVNVCDMSLSFRSVNVDRHFPFLFLCTVVTSDLDKAAHTFSRFTFSLPFHREKTTMGTCVSKRSACYDFTRYEPSTILSTSKPPETPPPATLRRFSSLRHSVKTFSSLAHQRRSLRSKAITIIKQSPKNKHCCIIQYNASEEALV